jgi:tRNA U34 2-thiouridine synthase MnmA/TrmU
VGDQNRKNGPCRLRVLFAGKTIKSKWIQKMWYVSTMEIKNNDFMKSAGKWMEFENIILSEVFSHKRTHNGMYAFTEKWLIAQKFRIPKIQFTDHKKEDQSVEALVLLRRGKKILTGGNMETKCRAETEGKAI